MKTYTSDIRSQLIGREVFICNPWGKFNMDTATEDVRCEIIDVHCEFDDDRFNGFSIYVNVKPLEPIWPGIPDDEWWDGENWSDISLIECNKWAS